MKSSAFRTQLRVHRPVRSLLAIATVTALGLTTGVTAATATAPTAVTIQAACTAPAWNAQSVYTEGDSVTYQGRTYEAKWWTQGDVPGTAGDAAVWRDLGACEGDPGSGDQPGGPGGDEPGGETNPGNNTPDSAINGYRNVGYFAQWGVYGRNFHVKDIDTSGAAAKLTHINYSFANIHPDTLQCFMANKAVHDGPGGSDGAGDAYADYGKSYNAAQSVSGVADSWDQPIMGSFNQLKQLKQKYPHIKVMISMGGWTYSRHFSRAAATDASRKALVSSCIDIYLKGNLPVIDGFGGPGTGAGIFDGIDIDWEWPGTHNGLEGNYVDEANDRQNFKLLLKEFREQLDALGAQNNRHYLLSGFLPANPEDIQGGGWNDPELFDYFDFGNIQGYDLWGAWDLSMTGHQANLWDDPNDPRPAAKRFSIDKAVKAYVNNGINPAQLGIGVAGYGRGWANAQSNDPWTPGTLSAAQGVYEPGINDYDVIEGTCTQHYDPVAGAAWCYNPSTKIWWSLDNEDSVRAKADYIVSQGLGGGMWWELSGDEDNELGAELTTKLEAAPKGPVDVDSPGTNPGGGDDGGSNPGGGDDGGSNPGGGDDGGSNPGGGDDGSNPGGGDNGGSNPGGGGDGTNPGDGDNGGQNPGGPNDDNQGGDPKQTPPRVTWHFDDYSVAVSGLRTTFRKPAKITVKATKNGRPTTGAVRFSYQVGKKAKTKSRTLSADGTAAVKLPKKLKVGKHQVHVSLTPTGSATSSRTVIVRVKRAKVRVVKQRVLGGSARLHISRDRSARLALVFKSTKGVKLKGKVKVFVGRKHVGSGKVVRKSGKWTAQVSVRNTAKKGKVYVKITGNKSVAKAKIKTKIRAK